MLKGRSGGSSEDIGGLGLLVGSIAEGLFCV